MTSAEGPGRYANRLAVLVDAKGRATDGAIFDDLTEVFGCAVENSEAGTAYENIRVGYRKYPVIRHIICCRNTANGVEVIRVLHDRMLATRQF